MKTGDNWKGWTIEELLGEGAFGQVFKISRVEMGNKYYSALKVINIPNSSGEYSALKNQGMNDSDINRYFRDIAEDFSVELRMMDELKGHSNIVSYENHLIEKKDRRDRLDNLYSNGAAYFSAKVLKGKPAQRKRYNKARRRYVRST